MNRTRVAIVDDALFIREGIRRVLDGQQGIEVVGTAASGEELLAHMSEWRPDVITLDLEMPGMGGLATLDRLMEAGRPAVIILSTRSGAGAPVTLEALSRGAVDFIDKEAHSLVDFGALRTLLVTKVLEVSGAQQPRGTPAAKPAAPPRSVDPSEIELIVIGASTGGPRAIETVLNGIGADLLVPIVIVQHMPAGFTRAFAERLDRILPFHVWEIEHGDRLRPGTVGIAPAGRHTRIERRGRELIATLHAETGSALHVPAVDELFKTAAQVCGGRTVAALLTGMGADGADGMVQLSRAGAPTIAQDEATCVVYGMPRVAVLRGGVRESLPLDAIGSRLHELSAVGFSRVATRA